MAKGDVNLEISGDDAGLVAALDEAAAAVTEKVGQMKETFATVGEGLNGLVEGLGAFGAIFASGEIASQLNEVAERAEQIKLTAQTFNLSTSALQGLQAAAAETGVSSEALGSGMTTLQTRMAQAAEAGGTSAARFEALGITLQELRDPSFSVIDALAKMGDAANSNQALMAVLGNRGAELIPLMRQLAESHNLVAESAEKVGAMSSGEIESLDRYKEGVATLGIEFDNLKGHVGAYVVEASGPLVSALKGAAAGFGDTIDMTIPLKAAFGTVEAAVVFVVDAFKELKDAVINSVQGTVDVVAGLGTVLEDVFTGKWGSIEGDAKTAFSIIKDDGIKTFTDMATDQMNVYKGVYDSYAAAFSKPPTTAGPDTGGNSAGLQKTLVDLSNTKTMAEQMTEQLGQLGDKLQSTFERNFRAIDADAAASVKNRETLEEGAADRQIESVQSAYKAGQISAQEDLAETQQLLGQKWDEQQAYFAKLRTLYAGDQAELDKLDAQEEKDHQTYLTRLQKAQDTYNTTVAHGWQQLGNTITSTMSQTFNSVLQGQETLTQGIKNAFTQMAEKVVESFVKMEAEQAVYSALGIAMNKSAAHSDAAAAAAGAAKSAAQIPLVGWILAPVAAAAVYAMASSFSAEGGFDIPAGLNPKTQLHEREMVLPQKYADVVRRVGDDGGQGGGDTHVHLNVSATDGDSVKRLFMTHRDALGGALKQLHRDGRLA